MADTDDSREKRRAYQRAWHAANRAKIIDQKRAWRAANPEKAKATNRKQHAKERENPQLLAYNLQKSNAKRRNIPFLLTFDEWLAIWLDSGKWEQRGTHSVEYCMARYGDSGPYAIGNVRICANVINKREAHRARRGKPLSANRLAALARAREALRVKQHT